jgi:hypothetical protein
MRLVRSPAPRDHWPRRHRRGDRPRRRGDATRPQRIGSHGRRPRRRRAPQRGRFTAGRRVTRLLTRRIYRRCDRRGEPGYAKPVRGPAHQNCQPTAGERTGGRGDRRETVAAPATGSDIKSCAYFSGSATLLPDTTLILTKRNLDNGSAGVYAELVFGWSDPASLNSWRGAQYFGTGNESTGQTYEVGLRAVQMAAAREFHASGQTNFGQAIARQGTQLDAVRVKRIAGEGPGGCPGP